MSKSASPGSSPCWMLPLGNQCGLHWVNTLLSIVYFHIDQTLPCVCLAWINLLQSLSAFAAVQNSTKGSYRDKRNQVVYNEDFLSEKK